MQESLKRPRDEYSGEVSPDPKRLLLDLLDDDDSSNAETDLETVMKSLEEELAVPTVENPLQPELGFLLEASDDELGLPPPVTSPEVFPACYDSFDLAFEGGLVGEGSLEEGLVGEWWPENLPAV